MVEVTNIYVNVDTKDTKQSLLTKICDEAGVNPRDKFAFGAIMFRSPDYDDTFVLKINSVVDYKNPYDATEIVDKLLSTDQSEDHMYYVRPPLDKWFELFEGLLASMVIKVYPKYKKLIPDKDDLRSILNLTVVRLYKKGYYLHRYLIYKAFLRALNDECRKLKSDYVVLSLEDSVTLSKDGDQFVRIDECTCDERSTSWAKKAVSYSEDDYWEDVLNTLRSIIIKDLSEFGYKRLLTQISSKTVDGRNAYYLSKYRRMFNPDYTPRPNAIGKNKGGKKRD